MCYLPDVSPVIIPPTNLPNLRTRYKFRQGTRSTNCCKIRITYRGPANPIMSFPIETIGVFFETTLCDEYRDTKLDRIWQKNSFRKLNLSLEGASKTMIVATSPPTLRRSREPEISQNVP
ncbi:hypothetical protein L798_04363 [Zootermopsis nevadensis]|uniref:Uncharacterized protein n=1 Tax=Zootermopsis nevadensis TaxID=136037 RepID=A0A067RUC2_ZOONE|nr:hypothetical protein L798_04363 [Zootermopsis nevadensis]